MGKPKLTIDEQIHDLKEKSIPKDEYLSLQNKFESELATRNSELEYLKEKSVPREDFVSLQSKYETDINVRDNELKYLREHTIPREDYINLQNELNRKNDKIKRLEEINAFFNELQEEQESYETQERTPPFRLEKKKGR